MAGNGRLLLRRARSQQTLLLAVLAVALVGTTVLGTFALLLSTSEHHMLAVALDRTARGRPGDRRLAHPELGRRRDALSRRGPGFLDELLGDVPAGARSGSRRPSTPCRAPTTPSRRTPTSPPRPSSPTAARSSAEPCPRRASTIRGASSSRSRRSPRTPTAGRSAPCSTAEEASSTKTASFVVTGTFELTGAASTWGRDKLGGAQHDAAYPVLGSAGMLVDAGVGPVRRRRRGRADRRDGTPGGRAPRRAPRVRTRRRDRRSRSCDNASEDAQLHLAAATSERRARLVRGHPAPRDGRRRRGQPPGDARDPRRRRAPAAGAGRHRAPARRTDAGRPARPGAGAHGVAWRVARAGPVARRARGAGDRGRGGRGRTIPRGGCLPRAGRRPGRAPRRSGHRPRAAHDPVGHVRAVGGPPGRRPGRTTAAPRRLRARAGPAGPPRIGGPLRSRRRAGRPGGIALWQLHSYRSPVGSTSADGRRPRPRPRAGTRPAGRFRARAPAPAAGRTRGRAARRTEPSWVAPLAAWEIGRRPAARRPRCCSSRSRSVSGRSRRRSSPPGVPRSRTRRTSRSVRTCGPRPRRVPPSSALPRSPPCPACGRPRR